MLSSALAQSHLAGGASRLHSLHSPCPQSKRRQINMGAVLLLVLIHRPARQEAGEKAVRTLTNSPLYLRDKGIKY